MNSKTENITLKGRLSIGNSQKIYDRIYAVFKSSDNLEIYLFENSEIDFAFLQIIYSLFADGRRLGKKMSVFIDNPKTIWEIILKAGFDTHISISKTPTGDNFRIEGIFNE